MKKVSINPYRNSGYMFIDKEAGVMLTLAKPYVIVDKLTKAMEVGIKAKSLILEELAPTIEETNVVEKVAVEQEARPKKTATKKKATEKSN